LIGISAALSGITRIASRNEEIYLGEFTKCLLI
jgi:hypothetical protein